MLQLMQAGIPVLQYLADHYKVTTAEAQEMVSAGKVSFADFEAAMREHIGGAAQSAGESFDGAMGNVKAALSRLGETVATPVINGLTSMANQAIPIIDNFTATAQPALEKVGTAIQAGLENALPAISNFFTQAQTVVGQAGLHHPVERRPADGHARAHRPAGHRHAQGRMGLVHRILQLVRRHAERP